MDMIKCCYNKGKEMINMKTTTYNRTPYSLANLTDTDLANLAKELNAEQSRRAEAKERRRREWIDGHYSAFLNHPNATSIQVGETTVVALYHRNHGGVHIGKATPVHDDKFNRDVGIAVAYAKANGEEIPYFI